MYKAMGGWLFITIKIDFEIGIEKLVIENNTDLFIIDR